jgi:GST-like protein
MQQQNLEDFPALKRWFEAIAKRPSSIRAYARKDEVSRTPVVNDESRKILFGQTAQS